MEQTLRLTPKFEMMSSSFQKGYRFHQFRWPPGFSRLEKLPLGTRACPSEIGFEHVIRVVVVLFAAVFLSCFVIDVRYHCLFVIRVFTILFAIVFFRAYSIDCQRFGDQAMKILLVFSINLVVVGRCSLPLLVCHSCCRDFVCLCFLSVFNTYWHLVVQSSFCFWTYIYFSFFDKNRFH